MKTQNIKLQKGDALLVVDIQYDFLPGGSLGVPDGDKVIPILNKYIKIFQKTDLPVFASRDWHPPNHSSFREQGGPWPPHCVAGTPGAEFDARLRLPAGTDIISKATQIDTEAYSALDNTGLDLKLKQLHIKRLFIGGLATDYCVVNTVKDALKLEYNVFVLLDGSMAINVQIYDERNAINEMKSLGAVDITFDRLSL
ncbi:isochorismatase family protein [candidate division KSB1 bacterium]|nr:isochorismatase family protein [candidate division KSB1 bacterium]